MDIALVAQFMEDLLLQDWLVDVGDQCRQWLPGGDEARDLSLLSNRGTGRTVEKLLDRGVVGEDGKRVSKQPGRCCPVGCQVPETPQLDYTPDDTPKLEKLDPAAE